MKTGKVTVLTDRYDGKRYNSPNDCCVDGKGRIWFTDPRYGADRSDLEMDVEAVYCIDRAGKVKRGLRTKENHPPQRHRRRPGRQDALRDRQPSQGGRQPQDLGVRPVGRWLAVGAASRLR